MNAPEGGGSAGRARRGRAPVGRDRSRKRAGTARNGAQKVPLLEWLGGGAGALAALAIIGFLAFEGVTRSETPAELSVDVLGARETTAGLAVDVRVANTGGITAADVGIEGMAGDGEAAAEANFDFVPRGSQREGTLVFPLGTDPDGVRVQVRGYREP